MFEESTFHVFPFQLALVFIVCIYLLTVFIPRLTFTLCFNKLAIIRTSFFHSEHECSRGITPIQVEIASLSFLFFSMNGLISASLLFEWPVYGCAVKSRLSGVDCVAESKLEL